MTYDPRGRKTAMHEPSMGTWSYRYNVLNQLISQTDAKGQTITMNYDLLGRMTRRTLEGVPDEVSTWTYDSTVHGTGKLAFLNGPGGYQEQRLYDELARLKQTFMTIAGTQYAVGHGYDDFGRPSTVSYPTGYTVEQEYDEFGYLWKVQRLKVDGTRTLLWMANKADPHARIIEEIYTNGVVSSRIYDHQTGDLQTIQTGSGGSANNIQNLAYTFDAIGNLKNRTDAIAGLAEAFAYDELNRLKEATNSGASVITKSYRYDAVGNITSKSDVGTYHYNPSGANSIRPHAVTSVEGVLNASYTYDANGNMTSGAGRTITYTHFNKPASISANGQTTSFSYDPNYSRIQKQSGSKTTIYLGKLYERVTTHTLVEHKHYIYGSGNLIATYTSRNNNTEETRYVHTDHLSSINVLTADDGSVLERLAFDPHGKRRQTDGQDATAAMTSSINRGFTRHEHDDEVGFINMNARLYDPILGRFISADTVVDGVFGQGLNRYSYVRNNPLSLTDPTGHFSLKRLARKFVRLHKKAFKAMHSREAIAVAALYAAPQLGPLIKAQYGVGAVGMFGGGVIGYVSGGDLRSTVTGAIQGAFFGAVGNFTAGSHWALVAGAHATVGGTFSYAMGGDFRSGFLAGGFGSLAGTAGIPGSDNVVGRAIIGGIAAEIGGGKFSNGALTAAYAYLFSEAAQGENREPRRSLRFGTREELEAALGDNGYTYGVRPLRVAGPIMLQGVEGGYVDVSNIEFLHEEFFYRYNGGPLKHFGFASGGVIPDPGFDAPLSNISQYRFEPIRHGLTVDPAAFTTLPNFAPGTYRFFTHNCQDFSATVRQSLP